MRIRLAITKICREQCSVRSGKQTTPQRRRFLRRVGRRFWIGACQISVEAAGARQSLSRYTPPSPTQLKAGSCVQSQVMKRGRIQGPKRSNSGLIAAAERNVSTLPAIMLRPEKRERNDRTPAGLRKLNDKNFVDLCKKKLM